MQTETLIIGGGLSGLSIASQLSAEGRDYLLAEARERLGGRILSEQVGASHFDLGPSWFWPGQPRIEALVAKLGLKSFDQFADGALTFEDERGQVQRGQGFASMQGSYRLDGGLGALIDGLSATLSDKRLLLGTPISSLTKTENGIEAKTRSGQEILAKQCVLALPPRIAAGLNFEPPLPDAAQRAMTSIATWMAGQAKAVAIYDRPFWREAGLSGDAMSRYGPLVEVHDASPATGGHYALFGFIGVPPQARQDTHRLKQEILTQLGRLFGAVATDPVALLLKDWAFDPNTSTKLDLQPVHTHPQYGMPEALSRLWDGKQVFAGTEVAPRYGGYLEGALEAAENALIQIVEEMV